MTHASYSCASRPLRACASFLLLALCLPAARADTPDSFFAEGKFEQARAGYVSAVQTAPGDIAPRLGLVRALLRLDRWPEAVSEAQAATLHFPQSADAHGLSALALIRAGWQPPCADEAKRSLALDASDYWGQVASGRLADWDGKPEEARADFRRAAKSRPDLPDAWLGLLDTLDDEKNTKEKVGAAAAYLKLNAQGHPHDRAGGNMRDFQTHASTYRKAFGDAPTFSRAAASGKQAMIAPIEMVGDYAVFPVKINGKKFRLLFDTGAGGVLLAKNPARRLGLTPLAHTFIWGVGGRAPSDTLRADTLALGALEFKPVVIRTMRDTPGGADGLLGGDVFSGSVVTIDSTAATVTVAGGPDAAAPPALPGDDVVTLPFRLKSGHLFAQVALNTVPVWAMLDTGAQETFLSLRLATAQLKAVPREEYRTGLIDERVGIGDGPRIEYIFSEDESDVVLRPPIALPIRTIGESFLDRQVSPNYDFEIGMFLGASTLTGARRVTFDYPKRLLTYEYVIPPPDPPVKPKKK